MIAIEKNLHQASKIITCFQFCLFKVKFLAVNQLSNVVHTHIFKFPMGTSSDGIKTSQN